METDKSKETVANKEENLRQGNDVSSRYFPPLPRLTFYVKPTVYDFLVRAVISLYPGNRRLINNNFYGSSSSTTRM